MAKDPKTGEILGTGRRKTSVARVRIRQGGGKLIINDRELDVYFSSPADRNAVLAPLKDTEHLDKIDVNVRVHGGGSTGQAGAIRLGLARALKEFDSAVEEALRDGHHLTRDARMKERKKYGQHGARRGTQFSKR